MISQLIKQAPDILTSDVSISEGIVINTEESFNAIDRYAKNLHRFLYQGVVVFEDDDFPYGALIAIGILKHLIEINETNKEDEEESFELFLVLMNDLEFINEQAKRLKKLKEDFCDRARNILIESPPYIKNLFKIKSSGCFLGMYSVFELVLCLEDMGALSRENTRVLLN